MLVLIYTLLLILHPAFSISVGQISATYSNLGKLNWYRLLFHVVVLQLLLYPTLARIYIKPLAAQTFWILYCRNHSEIVRRHQRIGNESTPKLINLHIFLHDIGRLFMLKKDSHVESVTNLSKCFKRWTKDVAIVIVKNKLEYSIRSKMVACIFNLGDIKARWPFTD